MEIRITQTGSEQVSATIPGWSLGELLCEKSAALPFVLGFVIGIFVPLGAPFFLKRFCVETVKVKSGMCVDMIHYSPFAMFGFVSLLILAISLVFAVYMWYCQKHEYCKMKLLQRLIDERSDYVRMLSNKAFEQKETGKDPMEIKLTINCDCNGSKSDCEITRNTKRTDDAGNSLER